MVQKTLYSHNLPCFELFLLLHGRAHIYPHLLLLTCLPCFHFTGLARSYPKKVNHVQVTLVMQQPLHSLCASSEFLGHHLMSSEHGSDIATEHADMSRHAGESSQTGMHS